VSTVIPLRQSAIEASLKQSAFDELALPALCFNASAQLLALNAAAAEAIGAAPETLVGRHLTELLGYSTLRASGRRWARLWTRLQEERGLTLRSRVRFASGRRLEVELRIRLLRFEQEDVAILVVRDIGAERSIERAERARRMIETELLGTTETFALLLGPDRRVAVVGSTSRPDLTPADVIGVPFELLLDENSGAEFLCWFEGQTASGDGDVLEFTWRLRPRTGGARWIGGRAANRLSHPLLRGVVIKAQDVTAALELRAQTDLLQRRLRAFVDRSADLLMLLDGDGIVRYQSNGIRATLGVVPEATLGQSGVRLAIPADQPALKAAIGAAGRARAADAPVRLLVRAAHADGTTHSLWVSLRNCSADAAIGGLLLTANDIGSALREHVPDRARQVRRLEYRERLLELAIQARADFAQSLSRLLRVTAETLQASSASFWRLTRNPSVLRCESLYDSAQERFVRESVGIEVSANSSPEYFQRLEAGLPIVVADTRAATLVPIAMGDIGGVDGGSTVQALLDAPVLLDGEVRGVLCIHQSVPRQWTDDESGYATTAALLTALAMEAAQRQDAESRVEQLAWYDSLTGLPNRNLLRETLRDMLMTAANRRRRIAVMLIDLDRFKDVNDTLGHLVGDALIKSAAQVLKETVGDAGVVARLGGDEFVVMVNEFEHRQEVALLAARIAQSLHRTDLVPNVDTQVSASIGVALFPEHGREMSTLLKNADAAMYQAKRDGRNQFSFFNPIRYERAAREVQLGIQLLKAVQAESAQFVVDYQPQVEMASGRVVGLEALIRWQHPTLGLLTPDQFVGVAEVSGLSERITRWVVNEVCAQIVRWRSVRPGFDIPVAINVAGREMGSASLPVLVRTALLKHNIEPRMIALEITERTLVKESEINNDVMTELASLGVGLVLDDFGTGYSMLGYLKRMPIQALKIDQSFVEGIPQDADSCAIVHAMLAVARHFRLKVVAEGIETAEQLQYLHSIGCEYAQGFFYSRPLSSDTILDYLERGTPVD
jgi:diguanylate cyclase (GGDEF)-like protein/PAS domain S-box-containing protein